MNSTHRFDRFILSPDSFVAHSISKIVLLYAGFSALWILLSDQLVVLLFDDPAVIASVGTAKGWLFVVVTSWLLASLLRRYFNILAEKKAELDAILENEPECVSVIAKDGGLLRMNRAGLAMLEADTFEEVAGPGWCRFVNPESRAAFLELAKRIFEGETGMLEFGITGKRGTSRWLEMHATPIRDSSGDIYALVGVTRDVTESKAAEARIEFLAFHDALTELPNRLLTKDRVELAMSASDRAHTKTALLFLDLDNFKTINDSLGHVIGDGLLKGVAMRLRECLRDTDTLGRQGGDEFIVVLPDMHGSKAIAEVCEKILGRLTEPFGIDSYELSTSFSLGIAVYPDDGRDFDTLLKKADTALYQAKEGGRNTYRFHTEQMNAAAIEHLHMRNGFRQALQQGEFALVYQPQVSLGSGAVVGAEALIRWNHPELGLVAPTRFISIAEDSGFIVPIGDWVLREACRQAVAWQHSGGPELVVAVNLSSVQFKRGNLENSVTLALAESGLDPAFLELELTESILIQDAEHVLITLKRLKALGVKLSIDDFGTGYSSLSYLTRFNVDKLKIDQSFVHDMADNPDDAAIVRAIIQMAISLNLKTVAEGVENERQVSLLCQQHCDEAQGYRFARPVPAEEFIDAVNRCEAPLYSAHAG